MLEYSPQVATAVDSMHPTGMHSFLLRILEILTTPGQKVSFASSCLLQAGPSVSPREIVWLLNFLLLLSSGNLTQL